MTRSEETAMAAFEKAVTETVASKYIDASPAWLKKMHELNQVSSVWNGLILLGTSGTGKSTLIDIFVQAKGKTSPDTGTTTIKKHKLCRFYPLADFADQTTSPASRLYGYAQRERGEQESSDLVDGII